MTVSDPSVQALLVPSFLFPHREFCGLTHSTLFFFFSGVIPAKPPVYGACKLLDMELEMVSELGVLLPWDL